MDLVGKMKFIGYVVANTIAATFGPALLDGEIAHAMRPKTAVDVVWRSWLASILFAGLMGALIARYRRSETAIWAWALPGIIFLCRALLYVTMWRTGFIATFSGYECAIGLQRHDCQDFFVFSIPLIRGASYSVGAWLFLQVSTRSLKASDVGSQDCVPIEKD